MMMANSVWMFNNTQGLTFKLAGINLIRIIKQQNFVIAKSDFTVLSIWLVPSQRLIKTIFGYLFYQAVNPKQ